MLYLCYAFIWHNFLQKRNPTICYGWVKSLLNNCKGWMAVGEELECPYIAPEVYILRNYLSEILFRGCSRARTLPFARVDNYLLAFLVCLVRFVNSHVIDSFLSFPCVYIIPWKGDFVNPLFC